MKLDGLKSQGKWKSARPGDSSWIRSTAPAGFIALVLIVASIGTNAATLPPGFVEETIATGLTQPLSLAFAPDGRIFVTERTGRLRVIKNGLLLPTPFLTVAVTNVGSHGLLGLAFDPAFASNRHLYVLYHAAAGGGRISRFTASSSDPDVAAAGSELVVYTDFITGSLDHMREIVFGPDGMLYFGGYSNAVRRIDPSHFPDIIPAGNPTPGSAIWATGFRAPTSLVFNPTTGALLANDAGWHEAERIRRVVGGTDVPVTLHTYSPGGGGALTGGAFYTGSQFPGQYVGMYFFIDHAQGFLKYLDANNAVFACATGLQFPVDLKTGPDGSLYYSDLGLLADLGDAFNNPLPTGSLRRIRYAGISSPPSITTQPVPQSVTAGETATFSVIAAGTAPLAYRWYKNDNSISGATSATYVTPPTSLSNNGSIYKVRVTNDAGTVYSNEVVLTVTPVPSIPVITLQPAGQTVSAPQTATFNVAAVGSPPPGCQWFRDDVAIPGATSMSYETPWTMPSEDDGAVFHVVVSNPVGSVISSDAVLGVLSVPIGGDGLKGEYFDMMTFSGRSQVQVDPTIDFDWGSGAPTHHGIGQNTFSVRWNGWIAVPFSEETAFHAETDEGVRLWVNGVLLIDHWADQAVTEWSGTILLTGGTLVPVQVEYFENNGGAVARLKWSGPSQVKAVIPQDALRAAEAPDSGDNDDDGAPNDEDPDDDNDGATDFEDPDRDGDGVSNVTEQEQGSLPGDKNSYPVSVAGADSGKGPLACGALGVELLALALLVGRPRRVLSY